jgi:hypothetical protein
MPEPTYRRGDRVRMRAIHGVQRDGVVTRTYYDEFILQVRVFVHLDSDRDERQDFLERDVAELLERSSSPGDAEDVGALF